MASGQGICVVSIVALRHLMDGALSGTGRLFSKTRLLTCCYKAASHRPHASTLELCCTQRLKFTEACQTVAAKVTSKIAATQLGVSSHALFMRPTMRVQQFSLRCIFVQQRHAVNAERAHAGEHATGIPVAEASQPHAQHHAQRDAVRDAPAGQLSAPARSHLTCSQAV